MPTQPKIERSEIATKWTPVRAATAAGGVYRVDECGHCDAPGHAVRAYQNMIKTVRSVAAQMRAAGAR
jgi:hypothetical protein